MTTGSVKLVVGSCYLERTVQISVVTTTSAPEKKVPHANFVIATGD